MKVLRNKDATRILVVCDTVGATQQISFAQPLADRLEAGEFVLAMVGHDPEWVNSQACERLWAEHEPDILFLSRYTSGLADGIIAVARRSRCPVVFHIDDDLLNVPESLGASKFQYYNQPSRLAALRDAMNASDFIYASTPALAEALTRSGILKPKIPGDIYCSMVAEAMTKPLPATGPVIGYMATGGHGADLQLVLPAVERLMKEIPELRFETFGSIGAAEGLAHLGARVSHHRGVSDYSRFLEALGELGWWVGIAPLEDTAFNRCKADTKWVEYTFAGVATVASDLPVYHRACEGGAGALAWTEAEWYLALRRLILDQAHRRDTVERGRARIADRYSRRALAEQLIAVIDHARSLYPPARAPKQKLDT